jgi:hypothetical protein
MHLRYAQPRIPVDLSSANKDIKDAFKVCPTPDPCLVVEGQRHTAAVSSRTENQIVNSSFHNKNSPDPGLPTTLDAFNAIPSKAIASKLDIIVVSYLYARCRIQAIVCSEGEL